jgi:uncharacterized protein (DUF2147 family)
MRPMRLAAALAALAFASPAVTVAATGAEGALEGRWVTFDADTGNPRSEVDIVRDGARATGRIAVFHPLPGEEANPACEKCPGERRGRRIVGLPILELGRDRESGAWSGTVLDPDDGRVYRCVARIEGGGARLVLRGYVLTPLFGREETWHRAH